MFFSKKLKKFQNIRHCFFSRKNGISQGIYESLNCGLGSGDNKENVLKNLELVSQKIGCDKDSLITLNQRHTNKVIYFENKSDVKNNWIGVSKISKHDSKNYCLVKGDKKLESIYYGEGELAYNGIAGIHDYLNFWKELEKPDKEEISKHSVFIDTVGEYPVEVS